LCNQEDIIVVLTVSTMQISVVAWQDLPTHEEREAQVSHLHNDSCNLTSRSGGVPQNAIQIFPSPFLLSPKHHSHIAPLLSESSHLIPVLLRKAKGSVGYNVLDKWSGPTLIIPVSTARSKWSWESSDAPAVVC